jgi:hypothetical protein
MNNNFNVLMIYVLIILTIIALCSSSLLLTINKSNNLNPLNKKSISNVIETLIISKPIQSNILKPFQSSISDEDNIIDNTNISENDILSDKISIMSSNKRATIVVDKKIILETGKDGLNFVILKRSNVIDLKYNQTFNIGCCRSEILDMIKFINKIDIEDIIIIVSKGNPFNIFSNKNDNISIDGINALKKIGMKSEIFRENDNFILITSKVGDIYYEQISPEPIYYPYLDIKKKECKINPRNLNYPTKYLFFNDKTYYDDIVKKCALESNILGLNKFGIANDKCIPITDKEYSNNLKSMANSSDCIMGNGNNNSINIYLIKKQLNNFASKNNGILFYELNNYDGNYFKLNEGEYSDTDINRQTIKSVYIPKKYSIFVLKGNDIISYSGPTKFNITDQIEGYFNSFDMIIIQKHYKENIKLHGKYNNKQINLTYGKGKHILNPKLFLKVLNIDLGLHANKLMLFGSTSINDLIDKFERSNGRYGKIKFPRIVRSIIVE